MVNDSGSNLIEESQACMSMNGREPRVALSAHLRYMEAFQYEVIHRYVRVSAKESSSPALGSRNSEAVALLVLVSGPHRLSSLIFASRRINTISVIHLTVFGSVSWYQC